MPEGLDLGVANGRYLVNTWEAEMAARDKRERLVREKQEREREYIEWVKAIRFAAAEKGVGSDQFYFGPSSYVSVRPEALAHLLGAPPPPSSQKSAT